MTNQTNKYQTPVGLQQPAAADLSDGTTGSGAVVLSASPALTGSPTAPTATVGDNTTKLATTAFVIANAGSSDTIEVNTSSVTTPFSLNVLVNGIGPVGEVKVNSNLVSNNKPCMVPAGGNLTSLRAVGTVYQNTSSLPMYVVVDVFGSGVANVVFAAFSDSTTNPSTQVAGITTSNTSGSHGCLGFFVMPGKYYKVTASGSVGLTTWAEWMIQNGSFSDSGDIHGSRALGTIYQNSTTNTLVVVVQVSGVSANSAVLGISDPFTPPVNQVDNIQQGSNTTGYCTSFFFVPPGHYYKVTAASGSLSTWHEFTWTIPCVRSLDYATATGARGVQRQVAGVSQSLNTGAGAVTSVVPYLTVNSNPSSVRWVQIICTNSTGTGICFLGQGESYPVPLNTFVSYQTTGAVARTLRGPVSPSCFYTAADQAAGTLTTNHWWEYQLG